MCSPPVKDERQLRPVDMAWSEIGWDCSQEGVQLLQTLPQAVDGRQ